MTGWPSYGLPARNSASSASAGRRRAQEPCRSNTGGGVIPAPGQAFPVLVCHSRGGTFATLSGHPTHTVGYGATAARAVCP